MWSESYQRLRKELISILLKLFPEKKRREDIPKLNLQGQYYSARKARQGQFKKNAG